MNTRSRSTICSLALLCLLTTSGLVRAQSKDDELLDQRISEFEVIDAPSGVLQSLARRSRVPIAMEAVPENNRQPKNIAVRANGDSVRNILDLVVEKDPQYVWHRANSVINVFPKHDRDPLLETSVAHFQVNNVNKYEAIKALENANEVKMFLTRNSLRESTPRLVPGFEGENSGPRFSLELEKSSFRDILSAIMLASQNTSWTYARYGPGNEFFYLYMW
jgi:hypothetical protein